MLKPLIRLVKSLKFHVTASVVIGLAAVLLFVLLFNDVKQETYELSPFEIAPSTIRSLKTVEDTEKTEEERERVADEQPPVYQFNEEIATNRQSIAKSLFEDILKVKKTKLAKEEDASPADLKRAVSEMKEKQKELQEKEPDFHLEDSVLENLLLEDEAVLMTMHDELEGILSSELSKPFKAKDLSAVQYDAERKLRMSQGIPEKQIQAMIQLVRPLIIPTETVNEELTEQRVKQARESIEPTRILQGQVLVREGQVIDKETYRQLQLTGLLTNQTSAKPIAGLICFLLLLSGLIYGYFMTLAEDSAVRKKFLIIFYAVLFLTVIMMKLTGILEKEFDVQVAFIFPAAMAPLLVKLLTNDRLAFLSLIVTAALSGLILQEGVASIMQMEVVLYFLLSGVTALLALGDSGRRTAILRTSLATAGVNVLYIAFYLLMTQSAYTLSEIAFYAVAAVSSAILSAALTIGLLPFFESVFNVVSDMRLIELSNPNHPLLKKVLTETPGTYHHSVMVANLADAACEAIGANGLLARVGSYYHDIGKTVRPMYFIENQHGVNPHDQLTPEESRDIIIAHAADGADILLAHKMPSHIIDIARQHHGTSFLKFFFYKAKELGPGVREDDFRYKGPKPQTKEIAVISIADSCEAAVRSMKDPTPEKISALVEAIVKDKVNDGQFDECDLSMKEIRKVEQVICETLNGIFHSRIEYPK
ncbi:cyclic-di-AMP phosphodiesterase PgpH [Sporosarcina sp. NCCP-2716]|uniref:HD family phosphohydrolase n=1 Tax=Sporosarcina sp. NCCP-2716 TaxID=2943679 RepID=UPI00203EE5F6|nr:HDIG domain-containing metalloprotein [Sporosarcina sp. NCCP-2716]GKV68047.1 cyclic-di-AMP phosphodiesterase PgpH [Sporosarcina sp. NCCP-2716]